MTLLERIKSADASELASFLCKMYVRSGTCDGCPAEGLCSYGHNGMINWLKKMPNRRTLCTAERWVLPFVGEKERYG